MREATQAAITALKAKQKEKDGKMKKIIMEISGINERLVEEKEQLNKQIGDLKSQLDEKDARIVSDEPWTEDADQATKAVI